MKTPRWTLRAVALVLGVVGGSLQLHAQGVTVSEVGNVTESRPPGIEILYGPGDERQAQRLARLLSSRSPAVDPIDPVTAAAAGTGAALVVVIT